MLKKKTKTSDLKRLVQVSIFLDASKKQKLLKIVETLSDEKKNELYELLSKEHQLLGDAVKNYLKKTGKQGVDTLKLIMNRGASFVRKRKEAQDKNLEAQKEQTILSDLNNV